MKRSYTLLLCLTGFSIVQGAQAPDQMVNAQINESQQAIDAIIAQANLDPLIAQALTNEINNLTQQITNNMQQDAQDIRAAATFTTILETIQKTAKANSSYANLLPLLTNLKYAARVNTAHTLIMGALPGQFKNTAYYTDPYTESIGFILNDCALNAIVAALVTMLVPTSFGKALALNPSSQKTVLASQIIAGLAAHCAWLLEKKFIIIPMLQNQDNTQAT
jgi:hypothetical protein